MGMKVDNDGCKTLCQRFAMPALKAAFNGADFGSDPGSCVSKCDINVPAKSAQKSAALLQVMQHEASHGVDQGAEKEVTIMGMKVDNDGCKTLCQRFAMPALKAAFNGADFGSDPGACVGKCDINVPAKSAQK